MGHHLLDELTENREQHKDTEELILKRLNGSAGVVEGETDEKTREGA